MIRFIVGLLIGVAIGYAWAGGLPVYLSLGEARFI